MKNVIKLLQLQVPSNSNSVDSKGSSSGDVGRKPTLQRCATILTALFNLEGHIDKVPLSPSSGGVKLTGTSKQYRGRILHTYCYRYINIVSLCLTQGARNVQFCLASGW